MLPTPELIFVGCRALQRAAQRLPNPTAFQRSFSSMAKPASFSASQGQSKETSTESLPPLRYLAAGHKASPVSITPSSSRPPAPPPAPAHPLRAATSPQPSIPPWQTGGGSSSQPEPAAPRHRAHSALRPAVCSATGTGDGQDEGNFSPFHASF